MKREPQRPLYAMIERFPRVADRLLYLYVRRYPRTRSVLSDDEHYDAYAKGFLLGEIKALLREVRKLKGESNERTERPT